MNVVTVTFLGRHSNCEWWAPISTTSCDRTSEGEREAFRLVCAQQEARIRRQFEEGWEQIAVFGDFPPYRKVSPAKAAAAERV